MGVPFGILPQVLQLEFQAGPTLPVHTESLGARTPTKNIKEYLYYITLISKTFLDNKQSLRGLVVWIAVSHPTGPSSNPC